MTTSRSTSERLGRAIHSSDLSHSAEHTTDVDVVGALGAAGIRNRQGSAILQMDMTLNASDIADAHREAKAIVRDVVKRNRWPIPTPKDLAAIARQALEHYIAPACPHCSGRGLRYEQNQSVRPCTACNATGKKPLRTRFEREVRAALVAFDRLRDAALEGVNVQLGRPRFA